MKIENDFNLPEDMKKCVTFHGHLCPGLTYGYIVAKAAASLLKLNNRSEDEEVVAICENDSCAVDAFQSILGTTAGKGNLIINNYGKNAYTIINRNAQAAYRFSRKTSYNYSGENKDEFAKLDSAVSSKKASEAERNRHRHLKTIDLLSKPFDEVFESTKVEFKMPAYAPLARSKSCACCNEMTMQTLMKTDAQNRLVCIPCYEKK